MTSTVEKIEKYLKRIEEKNKEFNIFLEVCSREELINEAKKVDEKIGLGKAGRLAGRVIGIKANINCIGLHASCASKVLEDYYSTYDATVIEKIKNEDGIIIGVLNCDEFACGGSGETSAFGPVKNPINPKLIPGGSSSGSAAAIAAGFCDLTLGSDTGGSIRNPASHCGVIGLKPTYASVSRYGLIDLSMSLDQVGPLGRDIHEVALLYDVIKGRDEKDSISLESKPIDFKEIGKEKKFKIGILDIEVQDKRIKELIEKKVYELENKFGFSTEKIKIPYLDLAVETYYLIVYTEFFSGTRKFDGRRYGKRIEEVCGPEVLRRIIGGSEITRSEHEGRAYYNSLKIKKLIEKEFEKVFKNYDLVISPAVPVLPHKIGEEINLEKMYSYDALTIPSSLAGNCAIVIPAGKIDGIPIGMQVISDKFCEQKLFDFSSLALS